MGQHGSKPKTLRKKMFSSKKTSSELSDKDLSFFTQITGLQKEEVKKIFENFYSRNPNGQLNKNEFVQLYTAIRPESTQLLEEISVYVFRCFDSDHNGFISFDEFLIAYALTSRG